MNRIKTHVFLLIGLTMWVVTTMAQDNAGISAASLDAWLAAYEKAWEEKDPEAAGKLFAANGRYFETPYAEPFEGPAGVSSYWGRVTADQRDIDFQYSIIAVEGSTGVASWSARFTTVAGDANVELNGVFVLQFDDSKRCVLLREWWHAR